jgi:hypothetical protein
MGTAFLSEISPALNGHTVPVETVNSNLQLGMVLLPNDLEVDPRFISLENNLARTKSHPDAICHWAKHFAPLDMSEGIRIPKCWTDFFAVNYLLHPSRFAWAKAC